LDAFDLVPERDFQQTVIDLAVLNGWLVGFTYDARRSRAGEPDLRMVHPTMHRMVIAELKIESGKLGKGRFNANGVWLTGQDEWAQALTDCPGVEYFCWKPSDWDTIVKILNPSGE